MANYNNRVYASTRKSTKWSQATKQERDFYLGYQPKQKGRPSILLGDRILIGTYTGNKLSSIPVEHLQHLIDTYQINNQDDKKYILQHIANRQQ